MPAQDEEVPQQGAGAGDEDAGQRDGQSGAHGRLLPPSTSGPLSVRLPALPPAPQPLPDESARRSEKEREEDDHGQHQHDGGAGGKPLLGEAEQRADHPGQRTERRGEHDHRAQPVGPLPCRRGGPDQHRRHQHHADGLQPDHHGDDDQRRQQHAEPVRAKPEAAGKLRIEGEQLELLVEEEHQEQGDAAENREDDDVVLDQRGGLPEEIFVEPGLVGVVPLVDKGEQGDAEAEEGAQHDPERRVLTEDGPAHDGEQEHGPDPAGDAGPEEEDDLLAGAGQQERDADAGQRGVRQRIPQQPLAAQDGEGAEDAADDPEQRRAERHVAQGVVEDQVTQEVAHARASASSLTRVVASVAMSWVSRCMRPP